MSNRLNKFIFIAFSFFIFKQTNFFAQCNQTSGFECSQSYFTCDISSLDGFSCVTPGSNFISFVGSDIINGQIYNFPERCDGVELSISTSSCQPANGTYEVRLYNDCSTLITKLTAGVGQVVKMTVNKSDWVYNLVIMGTGTTTLCDYTVHVNAPKLSGPKFTINNSLDGKLFKCGPGLFELKLIGNTACSQPNLLTVWTIDGVEMKGKEISFMKDFKEGSYEICAVPYYNYEWFREVCQDLGEYCVTLTVKEPDQGVVDFISCDGSIYFDPTTKKAFPECYQNYKYFYEKNAVNHCNGNYLLSTAYPKFKPKWIINNINGIYEIHPNLQIAGLCNAKLENENFAWYLKSDPMQNIIGRDQILKVNKKDDYCLIYTPSIRLNQAVEICTQEFCDPFAVAPVSNFISDTQHICPGKYVGFKESASNDAVAWFWEFEGGEPHISHYRNPEVYYDKPGKYTVKLTVENQYFSSSITRNNYIEVKNSFYCPAKSRMRHKLPGDEFQAQFLGRSSDEISIRPNPNLGAFLIDGLPSESKLLKLKMFTLLGQLVFEKELVLNGQLTVPITMDPIRNGQYIAKMNIDGVEYWKRLIILN